LIQKFQNGPRYKQIHFPAKKDQLEVLSIAEGFSQSTILFALMRLRVFERIGEETKSLEELADCPMTLLNTNSYLRGYKI